MQATQLRQMAEKLGQVIAFIPDPPTQKFRQLNIKGYLEVISLSLSDDDNEHIWVRGWDFSLMDGNDNLVEKRYLDASEMDEIIKLLRKSSDESLQMGYEYHSKEGVIFKKFHSNQRISFLTLGFALRNGVEGTKIVEDVCSFMETSTKLWE